jgi:hypothetical protein
MSTLLASRQSSTAIRVLIVNDAEEEEVDVCNSEFPFNPIQFHLSPFS